jgi:hypothetical protein
VEHGIEPSGLIEGVRTIERAKVAGLFGQFDRVWQW